MKIVGNACGPSGPIGATGPSSPKLSDFQVDTIHEVSGGPVWGLLTINGRVCMKVFIEKTWWWETADKEEPSLIYADEEVAKSMEQSNGNRTQNQENS